MPSEEENIRQTVERVGWSAISVSDSKPPFVYTVGLMFTFKHPELIIFGLQGQAGYNVLQVMVEEIRGGRSFAKPGNYQGIIVSDVSIATRLVHPQQHEKYLGYAMGYCRERGEVGKLRALQVFWPDAAGKFPFDAECEERARAMQPRTDKPARVVKYKRVEREAAVRENFGAVKLSGDYGSRTYVIRKASAVKTSEEALRQLTVDLDAKFKGACAEATQVDWVVTNDWSEWEWAPVGEGFWLDARLRLRGVSIEEVEEVLGGVKKRLGGASGRG